MDSDDLGAELVRLDNGFLVEDETYVVNSDDIEQEENNSDSNGGKNAPLREQDRFLPIANIAKIMKRAIPDNGKIAKDARECVQECISEFISFITSEASDRCQVEKRKTINGEDVLYALNTLGFDNYVEPLKVYLKKYREMVLSPVTINKLNKTIILYDGKYCPSVGYVSMCVKNKTEDGTACVANQDHDTDNQDESAVIYTYPKIVGDFTVS